MLFLNLFLPVLLYSLAASLMIMILPPSIPILLSTAFGAVLVLPFLYYMYRNNQMQRGASSRIFTGFRGFFPHLIVLGIGICIAMNNIISLSGIQTLFPGYGQVQGELYSPSFLIQIFSTVLVIPAVEELIFRGLAFAPIRDRIGFFPAAILSSLIFAVYHGNLVQGVYAFVLGFVMAWLYERYGTILAAYVFHLVANLTAVCVTNSNLAVLADTNRQIIIIVVTILASMLSVGCLTWIYRNINVKEEKM